MNGQFFKLTAVNRSIETSYKRDMKMKYFQATKSFSSVRFYTNLCRIFFIFKDYSKRVYMRELRPFIVEEKVQCRFQYLLKNIFTKNLEYLV